jgi:hypothetical protein
MNRNDLIERCAVAIREAHHDNTHSHSDWREIDRISVRTVLKDPHIARALALLNRVGDAAAEAMIKGEAAVVPVEPTIEMVRASNPMDDAQDLLAHFTLHEGIAAGRLDREGA